MKEIECKICSNKWYVADKETGNLKFCPFCKTEIQMAEEIKPENNVGYGIYAGIREKGFGILSDPDQLAGYLQEKFPDLKKEIRIFGRTFEEQSLNSYRKMFDLPLDKAEEEIGKLEKSFIEEEGVSEKWAKEIGGYCRKALELVQNKGKTGNQNIIIRDYIKGDQADWRNQKLCFTVDMVS